MLWINLQIVKLKQFNSLRYLSNFNSRPILNHGIQETYINFL